MGWNDPVVGGVALRRAAIQSPNYVAGTTGWTINQDGSVEFNNGVFRGTVTAGTFQGTDFTINSAGAFFYSGTPAAGNLIASIAPAAGTDSFGNHYIQGMGSYDHTLNTFAQLLGSKFRSGQIVSGSADVTNSGLVSALNTLVGSLTLESGLDPTFPTTDQGQIFLVSGDPSQPPGGTGPYMELADSVGNSQVDLRASGALYKITPDGVAYTWQTPTAATNWSIGSLQARLDGMDNVTYVGSLSYTGTSVTAAGAATVITAMAAAYRPKRQWKDACTHYTSTSVQKNVASSVLVNTDGTLTIQWGDGMASTTHDVNGLANGDLFWIETTVPLGNIA